MNTSNNPINVVVMMGGFSSERDISLTTGKGVLKALKEKGFNANAFDVRNGLLTGFDPKKFDVAMIALHGEFGEDGGIQALLEEHGLPYTGSGPEASRLAMDKANAKECFEQAGLRVAPHVRMESMADLQMVKSQVQALGYPLVVKPVAEGSSLGISQVTRYSELGEAIEEAAQFQTGILIEPFIPGQELTVGIVGEQAMPVIEIQPPGNSGWFDFTAKYGGESSYLVPAPLEESVAQRLQEVALAAHKSLGCLDVSRVDFRLEPGRQEPVVLEVNTIPGMTATSLLPKAAACIGMSYTDLCAEIVKMTRRRAGRLAA